MRTPSKEWYERMDKLDDGTQEISAGKLDMDEIAKQIGAERIGSVEANSGYFGAEDLKTHLPEEDLKESLGSVKSDMVKRVESERIGKQMVDPREELDVL